MKKRISFNIEQALANPEQVVCRNGEKPSEWHYFKTKKDNQLCICYCVDGGVRWVDIKGFYCSEPLDIDLLIEVDVEGTVYFTNHYNEINLFVCHHYKSIEDAINANDSNAIAVQKTTIIGDDITIEIVHKY